MSASSITSVPNCNVTATLSIIKPVVIDMQQKVSRNYYIEASYSKDPKVGPFTASFNLCILQNLHGQDIEATKSRAQVTLTPTQSHSEEDIKGNNQNKSTPPSKEFVSKLTSRVTNVMLSYVSPNLADNNLVEPRMDMNIEIG